MYLVIRNGRIKMMDGYEKQELYARLKGKLKRALAAEFWYEACMIEYAIIEDRTSSILKLRYM